MVFKVDGSCVVSCSYKLSCFMISSLVFTLFSCAPARKQIERTSSEQKEEISIVKEDDDITLIRVAGQILFKLSNETDSRNYFPIIFYKASETGSAIPSRRIDNATLQVRKKIMVFLKDICEFTKIICPAVVVEKPRPDKTHLFDRGAKGIIDIQSRGKSSYVTIRVYGQGGSVSAPPVVDHGFVLHGVEYQPNYDASVFDDYISPDGTTEFPMKTPEDLGRLIANDLLRGIYLTLPSGYVTRIGNPICLLFGYDKNIPTDFGELIIAAAKEYITKGEGKLGKINGMLGSIQTEVRSVGRKSLSDVRQDCSNLKTLSPSHTYYIKLSNSHQETDLALEIKLNTSRIESCDKGGQRTSKDSLLTKSYWVNRNRFDEARSREKDRDRDESTKEIERLKNEVGTIAAYRAYPRMDSACGNIIRVSDKVPFMLKLRRDADGVRMPIGAEFLGRFRGLGYDRSIPFYPGNSPNEWETKIIRVAPIGTIAKKGQATLEVYVKFRDKEILLKVEDIIIDSSGPSISSPNIIESNPNDFTLIWNSTESPGELTKYSLVNLGGSCHDKDPLFESSFTSNLQIAKVNGAPDGLLALVAKDCAGNETETKFDPRLITVETEECRATEEEAKRAGSAEIMVMFVEKIYKSWVDATYVDENDKIRKSIKTSVKGWAPAGIEYIYTSIGEESGKKCVRVSGTISRYEFERQAAKITSQSKTAPSY